MHCSCLKLSASAFGKDEQYLFTVICWVSEIYVSAMVGRWGEASRNESKIPDEVYFRAVTEQQAS